MKSMVWRANEPERGAQCKWDRECVYVAVISPAQYGEAPCMSGPMFDHDEAPCVCCPVCSTCCELNH